MIKNNNPKICDLKVNLPVHSERLLLGFTVPYRGKKKNTTEDKDSVALPLTVANNCGLNTLTVIQVIHILSLFKNDWHLSYPQYTRCLWAAVQTGTAHDLQDSTLTEP